MSLRHRVREQPYNANNNRTDKTISPRPYGVRRSSFSVRPLPRSQRIRSSATPGVHQPFKYSTPDGSHPNRLLISRVGWCQARRDRRAPKTRLETQHTSSHCVATFCGVWYDHRATPPQQLPSGLTLTSHPLQRPPDGSSPSSPHSSCSSRAPSQRLTPASAARCPPCSP